MDTKKKNDNDNDNNQTVQKKNSNSSYQIPWIEKYRPQTLNDVVGNEETVSRLQAISEDGNLPNLILCGPPGTGKVGLFLVHIETLKTTSCGIIHGC